MTDFPALTGSQKQIEWAEKIRAKAVEIIMIGIADDGDAITAAVADLIAAQTKAAWWIDNRDRLNARADGIALHAVLRGAGFVSSAGYETPAGRSWRESLGIDAPLGI